MILKKNHKLFLAGEVCDDIIVFDVSCNRLCWSRKIKDKFEEQVVTTLIHGMIR